MAKSKARARRRYFPRLKRRGGKQKFTMSLAIVAGIIPGLSQLWEARKYGMGQIGRVAARDYIGYDPDTKKLTSTFLGYGLYPLLAGLGVHMIAGKIGVNRMLARAGIPLLRL